MPTARRCASALHINHTADFVLVIGGWTNRDQSCAELLYANQIGQPWRWRTLTPMHECRAKAGMLLLSGNEELQRILVVGGFKETTEILTISCTNTKDRGQWTQLAPSSKKFFETSLVFFNGRILAIGMFHMCLMP